MKSIYHIAATTHIRIIRSSFYLLLLLVIATGIYFTRYMTLFEFGKGLNLIRELSFSSVFVWTLITALLGSHLVITEEIENKVAYTILSKPVTVAEFIIGKVLGITSSIFLGLLLLCSVMFYSIWLKQGAPMLHNYPVDSNLSLWGYMNENFFSTEIPFYAQTLYLSACVAFLLSSLCVLCFTTMPPAIAFVASFALTMLSQTIHILIPAGIIIPALVIFQLPSLISQGSLISLQYALLSCIYLIGFIIFIITLNSIILERKNI